MLEAQLFADEAEPESDERWLRSGELRAELKAVVRDLHDPRTIYPEVGRWVARVGGQAGSRRGREGRRCCGG